MNKEKKWYDDWNVSSNGVEFTITLPHSGRGDTTITFLKGDANFQKLHELWNIADSALSEISRRDREESK